MEFSNLKPKAVSRDITKIKGLPEVIYLIIDEDEELDITEMAVASEVQWCEDDIYSEGLKYVRFDVVDKLRAENAKLKKWKTDLIEYWVDGSDLHDEMNCLYKKYIDDIKPKTMSREELISSEEWWEGLCDPILLIGTTPEIMISIIEEKGKELALSYRKLQTENAKLKKWKIDLIEYWADGSDLHDEMNRLYKEAIDNL